MHMKIKTLISSLLTYFPSVAEEVSVSRVFILVCGTEDGP